LKDLAGIASAANTLDRLRGGKSRRDIVRFYRRLNPNIEKSEVADKRVGRCRRPATLNRSLT
jgi:hypothetical protein